MSHTIGHSITEDLPIAPGVTNFTPPADSRFRFVILRFTDVSLSSGGELRVDLGYDTDVFTATSGSEVWTRPIDPRRAPIEITLTGSSSATLKEYLVGERTRGTNPWQANSLNRKLHRAERNINRGWIRVAAWHLRVFAYHSLATQMR